MDAFLASLFELIQIYLREETNIQTYIFLEMCLSKINEGFVGFYILVFRSQNHLQKW